MYGGKFMPMHIGHLKCVRQAAEECERVNLILFYNGAQEREIMKTHKGHYLSLNSRIEQIYRVSRLFDNVHPIVIDVSKSINKDGVEDWNLQTSMVYEHCGSLDAVYASEPDYGKYFENAYPNAEYVMIDPKRMDINISATDIREMNFEERIKWMV